MALNFVEMRDDSYKCLIMYHPNDWEAANSLCEIVNRAGKIGSLFRESSGTGMQGDLRDLASSADCVISLITNNKWEFHRNIFEMRKHRFLAVLWNIEDSTVDEEKDLKFLRGCGRIRAQFDDAQFPANLICAINGTVRQCVSLHEPVLDEDALDSDVQKHAHLPSTRIMQPCEPELLSIDTVAPLCRADGFATEVTSDFSFTKLHHIEPFQYSASGHSVLKGTTSYVELVQRTKNGQMVSLAVKKFKQKKTVRDSYKHFARTSMHLRSPYLVPILEMRDEPMYVFSLTTPYMSGGNLENSLRHLCLDLDYQAWVVTTTCQISAGISFLHERNIVHGDVKPRHVLFDQRGVVKLVDYGMSTHENYVCYRPSVDVDSFARIVLQLLKPSASEAELVSVSNYLKQKLQKSGPETLLKELFESSYFEPEMWSEDDDITKQILRKVVFECCQYDRDRDCNRTIFDNLTKNLKGIMKLFKPALPLMCEAGLNRDCLYCSVQSVHPELLFRKTFCPETCPSLKACISCMIKFGPYFHVEKDVRNRGGSSNSGFVENVCHVHDCIIEPVLGGSRSFAMILQDASDDIAECTEHDAVSILQLATHPNIFRIPFKNVHGIQIPSPMNTETCRRVTNEMQQILDGNPSYFLFYYSGHHLVKAENKREPRSQYAELVSTLTKSINKIAQTCPRILMIFDCCYGDAVADLFRISLCDDADVEWHVHWMSCNRKQESVAEENCKMSAFTRLVVSALKGGTERPCPYGTAECEPCLAFRKSCSEKGYVSLHDCTKFVNKHMQSRQRKNHEDASDVHSPMIRVHSRCLCEQVISFFNEEPTLYTFFFESQYDNTINRFVTDDLHVAKIWNMTVEHHQREAHSLQFYMRYSNELIVDNVCLDDTILNDKLKPILAAVSKDNECLLVKIPMDLTPKSENEDADFGENGNADCSHSGDAQDDNADDSSDSSITFEDPDFEDQLNNSSSQDCD